MRERFATAEKTEAEERKRYGKLRPDQGSAIE